MRLKFSRIKFWICFDGAAYAASWDCFDRNVELSEMMAVPLPVVESEC